MTEESSKYNPKSENEVKGTLFDQGNIIYNHFYLVKR